MSENRYKIVFSSNIRPGFTESQVRDNLQTVLKLAPEKVGSLFRNEQVTVKKDLTFPVAQKYEQTFFAQGAIVKIVAQREKEQKLTNEQRVATSTANAISTESVNHHLKAGTTQSTQSAGANPHGSGKANNQASDDQVNILPFTFTGRGGEYFKIWIVNIVLSILTLGIYSAWAKVRNKQYFYGNTHLDGSTFEYTATPMQILKGRLVAFTAIGIYVLLVNLFPLLQGLGVFVALIMPWVVIKGLQFNANHSTYRNIRFGFDGTYWGAFKAFLLWPIASITIVLIPFAWHRKNQFFVNNSRYGQEKFTFSASVKEYYKIFGALLGVIFVLVMLGAAFFEAIIDVIFLSSSGLSVGAVLFSASVFFLFMCAQALYIFQTNNVLYNNTQLKNHQLSSEYEFFSYLSLLLTNTLGIIFTLGLFIPFAKVRYAQYHAEHTQFIATESLDTFVAGEAQKVGSLGEGLADGHDFFSVDVGV